MEHRSLQCFIALADTLHFGRAAKQANISQSGLSGQINRLELRLGAPLFLRSTRRVSLTEAGAAFLPEAREALASLDRGLRKVRSIARGQSFALNLGLTNLAARWGAHAIIAAFKSQHPNIVIETREVTSADQEIAIDRGDLDVGILHPPFLLPLDHAVFGYESLVAAIPRGHPHGAKRSALALADLKQEPLILFPRSNGPDLYGRVMAAFESEGVKPVIGEFAIPFTSAIEAVSAGRGIALVTSSYASLSRRTVVYRPLLRVDLRVPIALAWRRNCDPSLIENLLAVAREIFPDD